MIQLKRKNTQVSVDPMGAELRSLQFKGQEYLWQGDKSSWNGQSPQLFPVIGSSPREGWDYNGFNIKMDNHGFARKSLFTVLEESPQHCLLQLKDTEQTRSQYPFAFELTIAYQLLNDILDISYEVYNPSANNLIFSIGAHPGFNCPLERGLKLDDYYLEFNKKETIQRRQKDDYLSGEREDFLKDENRIPLDYSLFDRCAIILKDLKSDSIVLKSNKGSRSVQMDFKGFPDFGIWTMSGKKAPYICLEPWFGVDSTVGDSKDFKDKEGLITLSSNERFNCSYQLSLS